MDIAKEITSYTDKFVKKLQSMLTKPIVKTIKVITATIIVIFILAMAISLFFIGTIRALELLLPIWIIYFSISGISLLFAIFFIRKANKQYR